MNKKERVKLVFETLSKIAGFEIKPDKPFYVIMQGDKHTFKLDEESNLYLYDDIDDYFYWRHFDFSSLFRGDWKFEEIKEPLLTKEEKEFLRQFKFEELSISNWISSPVLFIYDENDLIVSTIKLYKINLSFDGLKKSRKYSRKELGL